MDQESKLQNLLRKTSKDARYEARHQSLAQKRIGFENFAIEEKDYSLDTILSHLKDSKFSDETWLLRFKKALYKGNIDPNEFFVGQDSSFNLHCLGNIISDGQANAQLLAVHCTANLCPLIEKNGLQLARSVGPYLVTLLSSSSKGLVESSAIALGNLALSGFRVAKVLVNQESINSLLKAIETNNDSEAILSAAFYSLYQILHALIAEENFAIDELEALTFRSIDVFQQNVQKSPVELFWVLFLLSCDPNQHEELSNPEVIERCLDTCTYEIFQKSDPRPLVKIVTPLIRLLANLCGGPLASEKACLVILRHPDITAIMMALLGTNYFHLVKETLWWFANMINNESVIVQEQFVDLNLIDKLEYHTIQAVQKLDPYAPILLP